MPISNLQFAADIERWAEATEAKLRAVFRMSAQDVIEVMQEVGPSKTNPASTGTGRMPVATGFLRASLKVQLNADPPPANVANPNPDGRFSFNPAAATLVINQADIGDRVTAGFTANYARMVEMGTSKTPPYGFVRYAAAQWQAIVRKNASRISSQSGAY